MQSQADFARDILTAEYAEGSQRIPTSSASPLRTLRLDNNSGVRAMDESSDAVAPGGFREVHSAVTHLDEFLF